MRLSPLRPCGFTLLEVLITLIILAIGLLGLANLQTKMQVAQVESYQRAQAVLLLEDMVSRIEANRGQAASYITGAPVGIGSAVGGADDNPEPCAEATAAAQDLCEWSTALKGASELVDENRDGVPDATSGAMVGGRGCVEQIQAPDPTPGICTPGIYRVSVVWQGMNPTVAPPLECGKGDYGDDALRRVVSLPIVIGLPAC